MDMEYSLPGLSALNDGARLDARMRFAMQLLQSPGYAALVASPDLTIRDIVTHALDLADALFAEGKERGWLKPLSTEGTISPTEAAHMRMNASAQVVGQLHGQKEMQEQQNKTAPRVLAPVIRPGGH